MDPPKKVNQKVFTKNRHKIHFKIGKYTFNDIIG